MELSLLNVTKHMTDVNVVDHLSDSSTTGNYWFVG